MGLDTIQVSQFYIAAVEKDSASEFYDTRQGQP